MKDLLYINSFCAILPVRVAVFKGMLSFLEPITKNIFEDLDDIFLNRKKVHLLKQIAPEVFRIRTFTFFYVSLRNNFKYAPHQRISELWNLCDVKVLLRTLRA